jgi:hypothetical protein
MVEELKLNGRPPASLSNVETTETIEADTRFTQDDSQAAEQETDASILEDCENYEQYNALAEVDTISEEDKTQRRKLIRKISRYKALFSKELTEISGNLEGLGSKSLDELIDLENDVSFMVSTRKSLQASRSMFIGGLTIGEGLSHHVGLKLKGLTQVASNNVELLETVDEISVKYEEIFSVDPVTRLGLILTQLILAVDTHNRNLEACDPSRTAHEKPPDRTHLTAGL